MRFVVLSILPPIVPLQGGWKCVQWSVRDVIVTELEDESVRS